LRRSKKNSKRGNHQPDHRKGISTPPPKVMCNIPNPLPIRQEATTEENKRYADEANDRGAHLRAAEKLNKITVGGIAITFIGLFFVGLSYQQSRRALELDQRAWIVPFEDSTETLDGGGTYFKVLFKNTGHTPGLRVHAWIGTTSDLKYISDQDPIGDGSEHGTILLAPEGHGNTSTADHPLTDTQIEEIRHGARVYIYGTIAYYDIFKNPHWTQFCTFPAPNLKAFGPCPKHNTTDDEKK